MSYGLKGSAFQGVGVLAHTGFLLQTFTYLRPLPKAAHVSLRAWGGCSKNVQEIVDVHWELRSLTGFDSGNGKCRQRIFATNPKHSDLVQVLLSALGLENSYVIPMPQSGASLHGLCVLGALARSGVKLVDPYTIGLHNS